MDRERATPPTVRISFEGANDDLSPLVTVYNPEVLSFACLTQVNRFGLTGDRKTIRPHRRPAIDIEREHQNAKAFGARHQLKRELAVLSD